MSGHHDCRCGRPITDGAHLCADCVALRVGLTVETREWVDRELTWDGGWTVIRRYERARVCGPWREVPNAD